MPNHTVIRDLTDKAHEQIDKLCCTFGTLKVIEGVCCNQLGLISGMEADESVSRKQIGRQIEVLAAIEKCEETIRKLFPDANVD